MDGSILNPSRDGRPTALLPRRELFRISFYWLGLSSIFAGLSFILGARLEFDALSPEASEAGRTLFLLTIAGALIAVVVQPTIGTISDYTISRWGRRKPYIFIGSVLDVVFLAGIALSQDLLAIAAFVALLQFSSNFAQGPFQGYVPDLVPGPQVGFASALVGMMQILGNVSGYLIGAIAVALDQFALGLIALGVLEVLTMLSVVIRVREGTAPKSRDGRGWAAIASEAWGTDILRERSFLWLVASRLAVLMAGGVLANLAVFYLARSLGMDQEQTGLAYIPLVGLVALGTVIAVVPAARASDRVGRKRVIYVSCLVGAIGLGLVAVAPSFPLALIGTAIFGLSTGIFLAVDWALMTDIIPKAESGRYMGISNIAVAGAGPIGSAVGGLITFLIALLIADRVAAADVAYRALFVVMALELLVGGLALRRVREPVGSESPVGADDPEPAAA